jgi:hypothetical protein
MMDIFEETKITYYKGEDGFYFKYTVPSYDGDHTEDPYWCMKIISFKPTWFKCTDRSVPPKEDLIDITNNKEELFLMEL